MQISIKIVTRNDELRCRTWWIEITGWQEQDLNYLTINELFLLFLCLNLISCWISWSHNQLISLSFTIDQKHFYCHFKTLCVFKTLIHSQTNHWDLFYRFSNCQGSTINILNELSWYQWLVGSYSQNGNSFFISHLDYKVSHLYQKLNILWSINKRNWIISLLILSHFGSPVATCSYDTGHYTRVIVSRTRGSSSPLVCYSWCNLMPRALTRQGCKLFHLEI